MHKILVLNPGSTSTKIALFENLVQAKVTCLPHSSQELARFREIADQRSFRKEVIIRWLHAENINLASFTAIAARGGLLAPLEGGTYRINLNMIRQLEAGVHGKHAANLGALIAADLGEMLGIPMFIVDPVVVDELQPPARISGTPGIERRSVFHALNQKASAKKTALLLDRPYEQLNLIVAHLGGGISVGAHQKGRVIDVNEALTGEGPFSPERTGSLPTTALVRYFFKHKAAPEKLIREFSGRSGWVAYLGTNDSRLVEKKIDSGDQNALFYFEAMIYQIVKEIGRNSAVLCGKVDQIILTGGLAHTPRLVEKIKEHVQFIAPVTVLPGENELEALAWGALRVLTGLEPARDYLF
ncbi:MAG: butyrate kinase [Firmicutes bacterium]|nr:butyrate kinase [Bacillota bacterium]